MRELDRGALPSARFLGDAFFLLLAEGEPERAGRDPFVVEETFGKPCACRSASSLRSMNMIWSYCFIRNRENGSVVEGSVVGFSASLGISPIGGGPQRCR